MPVDDGETRTLSLGASERAPTPLPGLLHLFTEAAPPKLAAYAIRDALVIGRAGALHLGDEALSRRHFEVRARSGLLSLRDLASRNGTRVGRRLVRDAEVAAPPGTVVRAGLSVFLVSADVRPLLEPRTGVFAPELGGPSMDGVRRALADAAGSALAALVLGESGAGKERIARAIHALGGRHGPIVAVNCGALPAQLVESELFGHQRGSFSGSDVARTGLFRAADGGTLFLDEIGELPLPAQAALLRVLDSGEIRAVGSDRATHVDVRVVGATNRDLDALAREARFRADLLHRLAGVRVVVPSLRARREDAVALCRAFLEPSGCALTAAAVEEILCRDWPGNVRELKSTVLAAATRASREGRAAIGLSDLGAELPPASPSSARPPTAPLARVEAAAVEQDAILRARLETALRIHRGNVTRAARDLGLGRSTAYEHITRLEIDPTAFRLEGSK